MSNAVISVPNLDIGPCRVTWNGVDLGATLDKVVTSIKIMKSPLKADQLGDSILDNAISGYDITVTTSLAETRDKTIWNVVFPSADLAGVSPADYLDFNNKVALRDYTRAMPLILHPLVEADASLNLDHYFYKALASEESSLTLDAKDQYKLKLVWRIFPDQSQSPVRWYRYGDQSL